MTVHTGPSLNDQGLKGRPQLNPRYNLSMQFAIIAMRVLEVMFFVGLAGRLSWF